MAYEIKKSDAFDFMRLKIPMRYRLIRCSQNVTDVIVTKQVTSQLHFKNRIAKLKTCPL